MTIGGNIDCQRSSHTYTRLAIFDYQQSTWYSRPLETVVEYTYAAFALTSFMHFCREGYLLDN